MKPRGNLLENLEQYQLFMEGGIWQLKMKPYYRTEELWGKLISQLPRKSSIVPGLEMHRVTLKMDNNPLEAEHY